MALLYLIFAIGFVSAPPPPPHQEDCHRDPQQCIDVALLTTDPKDCDHTHDVHCQDLHAPHPPQPLDCHRDPQQCIDVALVTTDPKDCDHTHDVHCQDLQGHEPVCGSDQFTYENKCEFAKARCWALRDSHGTHVISLVHKGTCTSSSSPIQGIDPNLSAGEREICIQAILQTCTPNPFGVTYGSFCEFHKAHCADATLAMSLLGQCPVVSATTTGIHGTTTTAPINSSHMPVTTTTTLGTTTTGITATTTSMKDMIVHVFCQHLTLIPCNTVFSVVCGSDGLYYPNECELAKASCSKPGLQEMKDLNRCTH